MKSKPLYFDFERFEVNGHSLMALRERVLAYEDSHFIKRWYWRQTSAIEQEVEILDMAYWAFQKQEAEDFFASPFERPFALLRPKSAYSVLNACFEAPRAVAKKSLWSKILNFLRGEKNRDVKKEHLEFSDQNRQSLHEAFLALQKKQDGLLQRLKDLLENSDISPLEKKAGVDDLRCTWERAHRFYLSKAQSFKFEELANQQEQERLLNQAEDFSHKMENAWKIELSRHQISGSPYYWQSATRKRVRQALENWRAWFSESAERLKKYARTSLYENELLEPARRGAHEGVETLLKLSPRSEQKDLIPYLEKEIQECETLWPLNVENAEGNAMREIKDKLQWAKEKLMLRLKKVLDKPSADALLIELYFEKLKGSFLNYVEKQLSNMPRARADQLGLLAYRQSLLDAAEIECRHLIGEKLKADVRRLDDLHLHVRLQVSKLSKQTFEHLEEALLDSSGTNLEAAQKEVERILSDYSDKFEALLQAYQGTPQAYAVSLHAQKVLWEEIFSPLTASHWVKQSLLQIHQEIAVKIDQSTSNGMREYDEEFETRTTTVLNDFFAQYERSYQRDFINKIGLLNLKLAYFRSIKCRGSEKLNELLQPFKARLLDRLSDVRIGINPRITWQAWALRKSQCLEMIGEAFVGESDERPLLIQYLEDLEAQMRPRINEPTSALEILAQADVDASAKYHQDKVESYRLVVNLYVALRDSEWVTELYQAIREEDAEEIHQAWRRLLRVFHTDKLGEFTSKSPQSKGHADAFSRWLNKFKEVFDQLKTSASQAGLQGGGYSSLNTFFFFEKTDEKEFLCPSVLEDLLEETKEYDATIEAREASLPVDPVRKHFGVLQCVEGILANCYNQVRVLGSTEKEVLKSLEKWQKISDEIKAESGPLPKGHPYSISVKDLDPQADLTLPNLQASLRSQSKAVFAKLKAQLASTDILSTDQNQKNIDALLADYKKAMQALIQPHRKHQDILQAEYRDWQEVFSVVVEWHEIKLQLLKSLERALQVLDALGKMDSTSDKLEKQLDEHYKNYEQLFTEILSAFCIAHQYTYKLELLDKNILDSLRASYLKYLREKISEHKLKAESAAEEGSVGSPCAVIATNSNLLWSSTKPGMLSPGLQAPTILQLH